jgi:pyruvate/2-oxoglutarate dehydrogenase complex dihydrolipoamide dehydrogenase (E3) component
MQTLITTKNDQILGFTVLGEETGEIIGAVQIAIIADLPCTAFREAVLPHPTWLESLVSLFSVAPFVLK